MEKPQAFNSEVTAAINAAYPQLAPLPLFTVKQFCARNPAFTESAIRNLVYKAKSRHSSKGVIPGNGMMEAGALVYQGRKVLLNEVRFLAWVMGEV